MNNLDYMLYDPYDIDDEEREELEEIDIERRLDIWKEDKLERSGK